MKIKLLVQLVLLSLLTGCATQTPLVMSIPDDPEYAPVPADTLQPPPQTSGSLYNDYGAMQLYGDKKARRVGDIITVLLDEKTSSKKSATANTSKGSSATLEAPVVSGNALQIGDLSFDATISGDRSFSGSGSANQSNSLQGSISVTITEIMPNGVLRVRGEKWITLNRGSEFIRISGMIRPEDILLDNTVSSNKLADARITYSGTGELAEANTQGWASRVINSPWWPF